MFAGSSIVMDFGIHNGIGLRSALPRKMKLSVL
jgi:hypothetical protein